MTDAPVTTGVMTIDEFIHLYNTEGPFEIIDGERIPVMPGVARHTQTTRTMFRFLDRFAEANNLGEVYSEGPFVLSDIPNWVKGSRVPDVMFFAAERIRAYKARVPDWEDKPFVLVPDLVVEVISPGDDFTDVDKKVDGYLRDGVKLVWLVNPQTRKVIVYVQGSNQQTTLVDGMILTGGDVLPGFQIAISSIFG